MARGRRGWGLAALLVLAGAVGGWGLATWLGPATVEGDGPPPPPDVPRARPAAEEPPPPPPAEAGDPFVEVTAVTAGGAAVRHRTVPLGPAGVVLVPLDVAAAGERLVVQAGGTPHRVVALRVDWDAGLARLETPVASPAPGLALSPERHPLYLGRDVVVLAPRGRLAAVVNGAAVNVGAGAALRVPLAVEAGSARAGQPVLDPDTGSVLGLVTGASPPRALDVSDLSALVEGEDYPPLSPGAFRSRYHEAHPEGIATRLRALLEAGRLVHAGRQLELLAAADPAASEDAVAALERALAGGLPESWAQAGSGALLSLVRAVRAGPHPPGPLLRLAEADALAAGDRPEEAVAAYSALLQAEGVVAGEARRQLRRWARQWARQAAPGRARDLLRRVAAADPGYAPHHLRLGRLAASQGDAPAALEHYRRARSLDPGLAGQLDAEMERLAVRSPGEGTTVPVSRAGGLTLVEARINGRVPPVRLIVDTGASHVALSAATAQRLGLAPRQRRPVRVLTAHREVEAQLLTLESIAVGGAEVRGVPALILPGLEGADGLLGHSFLRHFDVSLEGGGAVLRLRPGGG